MEGADNLAWAAAIGGLLLGAVVVWIPGVPGCAIGLLGLVAFAALTDFAVVPPEALVVGVLLVVGGSVGQIAAPVASGRAVGGSAGAATGGALGALLGSVVPLPGAAWALAIGGAATLGLLGSRGAVVAWMRGVVGTVSGCLVAAIADAVALLGIGAILAVCDLLAS